MYDIVTHRGEAFQVVRTRQNRFVIARLGSSATY
jgi:hypothetical protein